jgi:hypothetical protein
MTFQDVESWMSKPWYGRWGRTNILSHPFNFPRVRRSNRKPFAVEIRLLFGVELKI